MILPIVVNAATIPTCEFNREIYYQGESGYLTVTVFNDEENKIRVTELTMTINYYYIGGDIYLQTFYTEVTPSTEIEPGQNDSFIISFNLPTNVAPGYTTLTAKAITQMWSNHSESWGASDHPTYQPSLYIESSYKLQYEDQQVVNNQLQEQMQELQAINNTTTTLMYLLGLTTIVLVVVSVFLVLLNRKPRAIPQSLG